MNTFSKIFDEMRRSPMNDWVGGSDPELVGDANSQIIKELLPLHAGSTVLDFGCGIGRSMLAIFKNVAEPKCVLGLDIVPPMIEFCNEHIAQEFTNTSFEALGDQNDHYDHFIRGGERKSREQILRSHREYFSDAYAFSVFTHLHRQDFGEALKFVSALLQPGGRLLFTCFTLTEFSRNMIADGQAIFPMVESAFVEDGNVLWGNKHDPLAFIAFDRSLIEKMTWEAGLAITKIQYGCWMGGKLSGILQDVIVVTKPFAKLNPDEIVSTPLIDGSKYER